MLVTAYPHDMIVRQNEGEGDCRLQLGKINSSYDGEAIAQLPDLIVELKRCYRVIEDIESMIPDNHEEIDPVLSDILSECHRLLGM